jgi:imidazolonepropionase-like amidohydrolase
MIKTNGARSHLACGIAPRVAGASPRGGRGKVELAFGSDVLLDPSLTKNQIADIVKLKQWFTPAEALTLATRDIAQLPALSGPRNPYPGKPGVVEEGAYADLLLFDGDPTIDLALIGDPEKNFRIIMKDGRIRKNPL